MRFVTTVEQRERPFSPTAAEQKEPGGGAAWQATPATSWEQAYRIPPVLRAFTISTGNYSCSTRNTALWMMRRHTMPPLTCRFRSRAWKVLSLPRHDGPGVWLSGCHPLPALMTTRLCWVHHNHCERDEIVLQACIHDTISDGSRVVIAAPSAYTAYQLRSSPPQAFIFHASFFPLTCLRASCSGLPSPAGLRHMRFSSPGALHPSSSHTKRSHAVPSCIRRTH